MLYPLTYLTNSGKNRVLHSREAMEYSAKHRRSSDEAIHHQPSLPILLRNLSPIAGEPPGVFYFYLYMQIHLVRTALLISLNHGLLQLVKSLLL